MKRFLKTITFLLLSCSCLLSAAACANKSECNVPEQNNRAVTSEIEPPCENPECPPNPDCPVIPEEPDDAEDKCNDKENGDDDHGRPARPYPIRRRMRAKFLPIEIFFGEIDGQRVYYIVFPPEAY